jgi:hypothetical protein
VHTTVASAQARTQAAGAYDHVFYGGMAVLMALTVFAGFARTFYLRPYFDAPTISGAASLTPLMYLHGVVFTAWVVLFIVQTALIGTRRVAVHRKLGMAGIALAVVMVVVGVQTAIVAAAKGSAPPGADPLGFMIVPVTDMVLFSGFVAVAFAKRRDREAHKRLMLLAYVAIITAAIARIPGLQGAPPFVAFGLSLVFVAMGMAYDRYTRRHIHPVYLWGGLLLCVSVPGRLAIAGTDAWRTFAAYLVS